MISDSRVVGRSPCFRADQDRREARLLASYFWQHSSMKISVSLPDEDVAFLDRYAVERSHGSRSSVVHKAVRLLRSAELGTAYEDAWSEWSDGGHADAWEAAVGVGSA